jgi:hypothetical protein
VEASTTPRIVTTMEIISEFLSHRKNGVSVNSCKYISKPAFSPINARVLV